MKQRHGVGGYRAKPSVLPTLSEKDAARFFSKIAVADPNSCWEWTAPTSKPGYGTISIGGRGGRKWLSHRIAYALGHSVDPGDADVDHRCHNTRCCNPLHLRTTTRKQNIEHRSGSNRNSGSGTRGVCWSARDRKWRATVCHNGRQHSAGYHESQAEAETAAARLRAELFTHSDGDIKHGDT